MPPFSRLVIGPRRRKGGQCRVTKKGAVSKTLLGERWRDSSFLQPCYWAAWQEGGAVPGKKEKTRKGPGNISGRQVVRFVVSPALASGYGAGWGEGAKSGFHLHVHL